MLTIPKEFSGNNAAARKLREQGMADLERELGPASTPTARPSASSSPASTAWR
jgi:hypothetical protein